MVVVLLLLLLLLLLGRVRSVWAVVLSPGGGVWCCPTGAGAQPERGRERGGAKLGSCVVCRRSPSQVPRRERWCGWERLWDSCGGGGRGCAGVGADGDGPG